jgi:hypothetical protein
MTGQKDRYSTQEKLWELDDEQLTTPQHDGMVIELLNRNKMKSIYSILDCKIDFKYVEILSEVPIKTHNNFIVGYWDIKYQNHNIGESIFIEVKPTIDSFGKVLRQLNTYRNYENIHGCFVVLYTTDIKFKDAFESQGITVISPTDLVGDP